MTSVGAVVVPVFGTVALGFALARARVFDAARAGALVHFVYYVALPAMLFRGIAGADLPATPPWAFLAAFYGPVLLVFTLARGWARRWLGWSAAEAAVAGMSAAHANIVLLGYPLVQAAWGEVALPPLLILLATQSLVIFPLVTWLVDRPTARAPWAAALGLAANPILLALLLGLLANQSGQVLPTALARLLDIVAGAGPGTALVALGASLGASVGAFDGARRGGAVVGLVLLKNLLCPLLVWLACLAGGIDGSWRQVAVLLGAMPAGLNAFVFAGRHGLRAQEVALTVLASTALSALVASVLLGWGRT